MQYLLTQEELALERNMLYPRLDRVERALEVAATMLLAATGYICIHDAQHPSGGVDCYCDDCPLSHIGWETTLLENHAPPDVASDVSNLLCCRRRQYSK